VTENNTICALASGSPPAAIAIIRVSGPATNLICEQMLTETLLPARMATRCVFRDMSGNIIDDCLAIRFAAPNSYSGEDGLEIYVHGGPAIIEHALSALTDRPDVRMAEPGEFTRRAFENGKLDLIQAEGVADLIEAETRNQKSQALRQLDGLLSKTYEDWRERLIQILALIEVSIDFPDEDDAPEDTRAPVIARLNDLIAEFDRALSDKGIGERIREGFRVAIIGAPNAGKSTLLNRLAKREAAIVTSIPGTTRDVVEVRLRLAGQIVWVADTAGLRETADEIEAEGIRRARQAADVADIRIFLSAIDDEQAANIAPDYREATDIHVVNKVDQRVGVPEHPDAIKISALTGMGVDALEAQLTENISALVNTSEAPVITRMRHRTRLEAARSDLLKAIDNLQNYDRAEFAGEDVRLAVRQIGAIVGHIDVEDVLSSVFSDFCIGK